MATRTWGDGVGRKSEHVIADISYEADLVVCSCGWSGRAVGSVEHDAHRHTAAGEVAGSWSKVAMGDLATDSEVEAFLARLQGETVREEGRSFSNVAQQGDAEAHTLCDHQEGRSGTCYVGFAALATVLFDPDFPFERVFGHD